MPEFLSHEQLAKWQADRIAVAESKKEMEREQAAIQFYTGRPFDASSASYLFKYRSFDPELGRWGTPDPGRFIDGPNCYFYAPSPLSSFDYMGLFDSAGFSSGVAEFAGGTLTCIVGAGMMTAGSPTVVVAAAGAVVTAGGIISIGAGIAHMIEAFNDTNTWVPTSVQGTVAAAVASIDGQLTEQEQDLVDALNYLTGILAPSPETSALLLSIQASIDAVDSLQGSFESIRELYPSINPETGEPGYE